MSSGPTLVAALNFYTDQSGNLYAKESQSGKVYQLAGPPSAPPPAAGLPWIGAHCAGVHCAAGNLNPLVDGTFVKFDTLDWDTDGYITGPLPVSSLIVPSGQGGLYHIETQVDTFSSANQAIQGATIIINGSTTVAKSAVQQQGTTGGSLNISTLWHLKDGDQVQVQYNDTNSNPSSYLKIIVPGTPSLGLARIA